MTAVRVSRAVDAPPHDTARHPGDWTHAVRTRSARGRIQSPIRAVSEAATRTGAPPPRPAVTCAHDWITGLIDGYTTTDNGVPHDHSGRVAHRPLQSETPFGPLQIRQPARAV